MTVGNNNEETIRVLKLKLLIEQEKTKRIKTQHQHCLASLNKELNPLRNHLDFDDFIVDGNIESFNINFMLNSDNYFNDHINN
jgi:hypothetical protein